MDTLDKYELVISKIQEMCTSTVAMAPYPINGISVTTVSYKPGKKGKSQKQEKMPTKPKAIVEKLNRGNNMSITETMYELAKLCEAMYWGGKEVSNDEYRANLDAAREEAAEKLAKWKAEYEKNKPVYAKIRDGIEKVRNLFSKGKTTSKGSKEVIDNIVSRLKAIVNKGDKKETINCSYLTEGRHLKEIDKKIYQKMVYHSYGPKFKERVMRNERSLQDKRARLMRAQDTAERNILMGQIGRLENNKHRFSREQRAKMFKRLGKQIEAQIVRNPSRVRSKFNKELMKKRLRAQKESRRKK